MVNTLIEYGNEEKREFYNTLIEALNQKLSEIKGLQRQPTVVLPMRMP